MQTDSRCSEVRWNPPQSLNWKAHWGRPSIICTQEVVSQAKLEADLIITSIFVWQLNSVAFTTTKSWIYPISSLSITQLYIVENMFFSFTQS